MLILLLTIFCYTGKVAILVRIKFSILAIPENHLELPNKHDIDASKSVRNETLLFSHQMAGIRHFKVKNFNTHKAPQGPSLLTTTDT